MKTILILASFISIFVNSKAFGFTRDDLQTGDVLLLSFNCYECRVIESETNSAFSHSGVVIVDENNQIRVAQSLGKVEHYSFVDFIKYITPKTKVSVYRPKEFSKLTKANLRLLEKGMLNVFNTRFKGAPFDSLYEWDNFDSKGNELLYCSEFIAKFLDHFLVERTIPLPMTYQKHYDYWFKYFKGVVPENVPGNSPASFSRDDRFVFMGQIY